MATRSRRGSAGTRRGSKAEFHVRTVKTKEDRKRPSVFMRLKTDESFKGVALFEPDPELEDNPGYYEYYDHYDKQGNSYVPCAGDQCPFCAANDNPSTRALTVWYFPDAGDVKDQIKVFTMNYSTINDASDEAEEEDGLIGKKVRIKRLSDKGDYKFRILTDKPLTKAQLKAAMALLEEKFGEEGLEGLVLKQLKTQMERLKALDALDDDEDEDEDEAPARSRRGKAKDEEEDEEDEDDEDDEEEDEEDEDDEDEEEEDEDEEDEEEESDEDEDEEEEDEDEEGDEDEEEEEEEVTEITGVVYEVVKVQESDEIFDLKNDDEKVKMWLGEGVDVDYDKVKKGVTVKVDAAQDEEGDWIITKLVIPRTRTAPAKTSTRKTTTRGRKR